MAVPFIGTHKCRQPLSASFLYHHVQRSGVVSAYPDPEELGDVDL